MKSLKHTAVAFVAGCVLACAAAASYAAQHSIMEKGKVFSEAEITIKVGDTLVFVNDDNIAHNVLSTSPGNSFNLGLLAPGTSVPVTFNTPGEIPIICAIHPSMKMTVKVVN
jgi:plastocyanin